MKRKIIFGSAKLFSACYRNMTQLALPGNFKLKNYPLQRKCISRARSTFVLIKHSKINFTYLILPAKALQLSTNYNSKPYNLSALTNSQSTQHGCLILSLFNSPHTRHFHKSPNTSCNINFYQTSIVSRFRALC